jgi:hypothetical protein
LTFDGIEILKLGMTVHPCNSSTQEAEAGGLKVQGQPALYRETLSTLSITITLGEHGKAFREP